MKNDKMSRACIYVLNVQESVCVSAQTTTYLGRKRDAQFAVEPLMRKRNVVALGAAALKETLRGSTHLCAREGRASECVCERKKRRGIVRERERKRVKTGLSEQFRTENIGENSV